MQHSAAYDYGIVGNHFSAALISRFGSVDWLCLPYLDSPSIFASYVNKNQGGKFQIIPQGTFRSEQRYYPQTQVLETYFDTPLGTGLVVDWMPIDTSLYHGAALCRLVQVIEGKICWLLSCIPRFKYGELQAQAEPHPNGVLFRGDSILDLILLQSDVPLEISLNGGSAVCRLNLEAGQERRFYLAWGRQLTPIQADLATTINYWKPLSHQCPARGCIFEGPWHETVARSGLTLHLLSNSYSNSISEGVAVLMEDETQTRDQLTWKDRWASIRNGGMRIQALVNLGYPNIAKHHFLWIARILARDGVEGLQSIYTLDGGKLLPHENLSQQLNRLAYSRRFQLDIYGHVVVAANLYQKIFGDFPRNTWNCLIELADYVCQAWKRPDHGPGGASPRAEHFVSSKVFCWAALNQMCQLATALGDKPSPRWISEKAILHKTISEQGYDPDKNSFVRSFGSREIDASSLWMIILNFLPLDDPRIQGTLDRINVELSKGILLRTSNLAEEESLTFNSDNDSIDLSSSFLFASCLALNGQVDEASDRLAELSSYASSLGLFADSIYPSTIPTNKMPRIFPSASTHVALINAALYIGWARGKYSPVSQLMGCEPGRFLQKKSA